MNEFGEPMQHRSTARTLARMKAAKPTTWSRVLVRVENVSKHYYLGEQRVQALNRVNLNIEQGVFMAIAGPSGSGKSTLLNLIGCIDTPTSGRIFVADRDVSGKTPNELAALRARTIGFIFQTFNLLPVLSAEENVEYPLLQFKELSAGDRRRRVEQYLDVVGLAEFARHRPNQLSGGQRQRVAIARALAVHPKIILADEPTANLDHKTGGRILRLMRRINRDTGATFVFSTHDQRVIDMADRRVDLEDGEIVRLGVRRGKEWGYAMERAPDPSADDEDTHELDRD
jgi:putative ABC transport system ATP-binding protein